jgi:hypothetical protein
MILKYFESPPPPILLSQFILTAIAGKKTRKRKEKKESNLSSFPPAIEQSRPSSYKIHHSETGRVASLYRATTADLSH